MWRRQEHCQREIFTGLELSRGAFRREGGGESFTRKIIHGWKDFRYDLKNEQKLKSFSNKSVLRRNLQAESSVRNFTGEIFSDNGIVHAEFS